MAMTQSVAESAESKRLVLVLALLRTKKDSGATALKKRRPKPKESIFPGLI
jgi:hypothetical protein